MLTVKLGNLLGRRRVLGTEMIKHGWTLFRIIHLRCFARKPQRRRLAIRSQRSNLRCSAVLQGTNVEL